LRELAGRRRGARPRQPLALRMKIAIIGSASPDWAPRTRCVTTPASPLRNADRASAAHQHVDVTLTASPGRGHGLPRLQRAHLPQPDPAASTNCDPVAKTTNVVRISVALGGGRRLEWAGTGPRCSVRAAAQPAVGLRFLACCATSCASTAKRRGSRRSPARRWSFSRANSSIGALRDAFRRWYCCRMAAAICRADATMLAYPLATLPLLPQPRTAAGREPPQWFTVRAAHASSAQDREPHPRCAARRRGRFREARRRHGQVVVRAGTASSATTTRARVPQRPVARAAVGRRRLRARISKPSSTAQSRGASHRHRLMPKLRSVWSSWNYMSDGGRSRTCRSRTC